MLFNAAYAGSDESRVANDDATARIADLEIHGYVEKIRIEPEGVVLSARMDSGATSSSLNAINQRRFRRNGERWIEFDILDPSDEGETIRIRRPIERFVRIIRHEGEQRRPVVRMTFCIGTKSITADTTLIDRTNLTYQALVGRAHLAGHVLVDSSKRYLMEPACEDSEADIGANTETDT
ncbi:MAG: ATP-dependent zinc protease [Thioalkalivibrionaceae bacterium]